jgi:hypothetical protein
MQPGPGRGTVVIGKDPLAPVAGKPTLIPCCHCIGDKGFETLLDTGTVGWKLVGSPSGAPAPGSPLYLPTQIHSLWTGSAPPAKWLQPVPGYVPNLPGGVYTYETQFTVPNCTLYGGATLTGEAWADDGVKASLIGPGGGVLGQTTSAGYGFELANGVTLNHALQPGATYTLRMEVQNYADTHITPPGSPSGLLVHAVVKTICPMNMEKGRVDPTHEVNDPR